MSSERCWASALSFRTIQWIWHPFIQRGAINLLTGGPGTGKSTISVEIAAALSKARPLPGETEETAKSRGIVRTWLLNAEDDPEDTTIWRLKNQGADFDQILIEKRPRPIDQAFAKEMFDVIRANNIGLVIIDPVQAWIPPDTDMHRANQMRDWGNLFKNLCQDTGVTVIWVRHRRKGDADDQNSLNSGLGSIDMSGIVRSEIGALVTKKGSRITRIKGNVGPTNVDLTYSIQGTDNDHGQLSWSAATQPKASLDVKVRRSNPLDAWLIGLLVEGPRLKTEIIDRAKALGYGERTVEARASEITVGFWEEGKRKWRLRTPSDTTSDDEDTATDAS